MLLVEGASDKAAILTLASRVGLDLQRLGGRVVAMGGVTNLGHHLATSNDADVIAVLYDIGETSYVERAVGRFVGARPLLFPCDLDLEDELIRGLGKDRTIEVIEAAGDLPKWHILIEQPFHRDRPTGQVLRRFFGTTSGRKARYAELLCEALDLDRLPDPLAGALLALAPRWTGGLPTPDGNLG